MNVINGSKYEGKDAAMAAVFDFYIAFNNQDIDLMEKVWKNSEQVRMYNPIGGSIDGYEAIIESYRRIFRKKVFVEFYDFRVFSSKEQFLIFGKERGSFDYDGHRHKLMIRTTRIFQKDDDGWKLVHHHGSIDDPELLRMYMEATRA